jgi:hypothetical protein
LPPAFSDIPREIQDRLESNEDLQIDKGGVASAAYARLQFEDLVPLERQRIREALLRYCELVTLAMAMIVEAWRDWCFDQKPTATSRITE